MASTCSNCGNYPECPLYFPYVTHVVDIEPTERVPTFCSSGCADQYVVDNVKVKRGARPTVKEVREARQAFEGMPEPAPVPDNCLDRCRRAEDLERRLRKF